MLRVVDITSGERYQWGSASEGWHLLNQPELSVIQERVPPGDRERRHFHSKAPVLLRAKWAGDFGGGRFSVRSWCRSGSRDTAGSTAPVHERVAERCYVFGCFMPTLTRRSHECLAALWNEQHAYAQREP